MPCSRPGRKSPRGFMLIDLLGNNVGTYLPNMNQYTIGKTG